MAVYQITFKPAGKYFFGNEKGFGFSKKNTRYFIRSEELPLQSTLFGALRYLMLPEKGYDKAAVYKNIIGSESFDITCKNQTFGVIRQMSPLFLSRGDEWFIPTPFDHDLRSEKTKDENQEEPGEKKEKTFYYKPFQNYTEIEDTLDGKKLFTEEYDSKEGTAHSYMSLSDLHIENNLFESSVQVGINRKNTKDGFFKKEYKLLNKDFAFSVLAEIDDETLDNKKESVLLGQGKTPFSVTFLRYSGENLTQKVRRAINEAKENAEYKNYVYFLSDCYLGDSDMEEYYKSFLFCNIQPRDYRTFKTRGNTVEKGSALLHLIKAGSIAIPREETAPQLSESFKNARVAGFNYTVTQKGE